MGSKRSWQWAARALALAAALVIPACSVDSGQGVSGPSGGIFWNNQSGGAVQGGNGQGGSFWVDPNSGLGASPIGIQNIIKSSDEATYGKFVPAQTGGINTSQIVYIQGSDHPLLTDTTSISITGPESQLLADINAFRVTILGNNGNAGGGNGNQVTPSPVLSGTLTGTKSARAHAKHYAYFHAPGALPNTNFEGDNLRVGTLPGIPPYATALAGRLGKVGVTSFDPTLPDQFNYIGAAYSSSSPVLNALINNARLSLLGDIWTHIAAGFWKGGQNAYQWSVIFLARPTPSI